jgi:hypothetical protein
VSEERGKKTVLSEDAYLDVGDLFDVIMSVPYSENGLVNTDSRLRKKG